MSSSDEATVARILANPRYLELKHKRSRFACMLTLLMLLVYFGFIGLIAFDKELLATPLGAGVTTLGIPLGIGVIVFTVIITGLYVRRANGEFDRMTRDILEDANP